MKSNPKIRITILSALFFGFTPLALASDWVTIPFVLESNHPYNSDDQSGVPIKIEGAKRMKLVLSRIETESSYDYFDVFDGNGTQIEHLNGDYTDHTTPVIDGDYAYIAISRDTSGDEWGYKLDQILVQY